MGDGALTKAQLDEMMIEWRRWRAEMDAPVEQKAMGRNLAVPAGTTRDAALIKGLIEAIAPCIVNLEKQVAALQARIVELEAGTMRYCGVHQTSIAYRKGCVVTYDGAAWCATRDVSVEKPGHGDGWQLMVKAHREASPRSDASAAAHARNGSTLPPSNPRFR